MPIPTSGVRVWCDLKRTAANILHCCSIICASKPLVCNPSIFVVGCLDPARECSVAVLCKIREPILCGESGSESAREGGQCIWGDLATMNQKHIQKATLVTLTWWCINWWDLLQRDGVNRLSWEYISTNPSNTNYMSDLFHIITKSIEALISCFGKPEQAKLVKLKCRRNKLTTCSKCVNT